MGASHCQEADLATTWRSSTCSRVACRELICTLVNVENRVPVERISPDPAGAGQPFPEGLVSKKLDKAFAESVVGNQLSSLAITGHES
jgi:hypothetical protein